MSFRMSARAKGMLSSVGDENGGDGRSQKDAASANGESHGPAVDEGEVKCKAVIFRKWSNC